MSDDDKTRKAGTRTIVLALSVAAFVTPGVAHGKPAAGTPLNAAVCTAISGAWTPASYTCTIAEGTSAIVSSSFKIGGASTLDIKGSLTIARGVTVTNLGTIVVENVGGVVPEDFDPWHTGLLVYGTLDNAGTMAVQNTYEYPSEGCGTPPGTVSCTCEMADQVHCTEGITVSMSIDAADPSDPTTPYVLNPGVLTNAGTIIIANSARTRGIKNLGALANHASGTIIIANTGTSSVGLYNRRDGAPLSDEYYRGGFAFNGRLSNAGSITISNTGDRTGWGIYNVGLFTNAATGTFTIALPSGVIDDAAGGFYNASTFTNFGTFTNDRGVYVDWIAGQPVPRAPQDVTWGSFNAAGAGAMINHGTTSAKGTFYNDRIMINLGTITSEGLLFDATSPYTMLNYGTFYNSGVIIGGLNYGICLDEIWKNPQAGGC